MKCSPGRVGTSRIRILTGPPPPRPSPASLAAARRERRQAKTASVRRSPSVPAAAASFPRNLEGERASTQSDGARGVLVHQLQRNLPALLLFCSGEFCKCVCVCACVCTSPLTHFLSQLINCESKGMTPQAAVGRYRFTTTL